MPREVDGSRPPAPFELSYGSRVIWKVILVRSFPDRNQVYEKHKKEHSYLLIYSRLNCNRLNCNRLNCRPRSQSAGFCVSGVRNPNHTNCDSATPGAVPDRTANHGSDTIPPYFPRMYPDRLRPAHSHPSVCLGNISVILMVQVRTNAVGESPLFIGI